MIKTVIILTLSLKFEDYCIAAYDASRNEMVRLVRNTARENGIPKKYAYGIELLDEVTIKVLDYCPKEHQTENVKIDLDYGLKKTGRSASIDSIYDCLQKGPAVFGSTDYRVWDVSRLDHSLEIVKFRNMHIQQREVKGKNKTKANFICDSENHIGYSVTDAKFFDSDKRIASGYSIVSLPASDDFTEQYGYFKYISAIYSD